MIRATTCSAAMALLLCACVGCPQYHDPTAPNDIVQSVAPESDTPYLLYVPSQYDREYKWPLVVLCHGTRPWDTPVRQIRDWVQLAEEEGFLVVAPELVGTSAFPKPAAEEQIARQMEDERRILSTLRHVRGAYNISRDRVFLTGWSAGNYAVLYTGLKNPHVFRALALQQGNFDAAYLTDVGRIDPYQPISVIYGRADFLIGPDARECIEWLQDRHADVTPLDFSGGHRGHPVPARQFFERVLRETSWLHIRAFTRPDDDPLVVNFKTRTSFRALHYEWHFGDGDTSAVANPVHHYRAPGKYRVELTVLADTRRRVQRTTTITVPLPTTAPDEPNTWTTAE